MTDKQHNHSHNHNHSVTGNIKTAIILNTAFALIELVGGFWSNSVAILSDALHDFGDSVTLAMSYYFHKKSQRKNDASYSYGYKRFSLIGAVVASLVLFAGSLFIIKESVQRLMHPEPADASGMFLIAVLGLAVNGVALLRLRKGNAVVEQVLTLHFLEDVLGWVAVLLGSAIMYFTGWLFIDPLLSLCIAAFILFNVYGKIKQVSKILMQGVPENTDLDEIRKTVLSIQGVESLHDLHVWTMDGDYNILSLHVAIGSNLTVNETDAIKTKLRNLLAEKNIQHATIEIENLQCRMTE